MFAQTQRVNIGSQFMGHVRTFLVPKRLIMHKSQRRWLDALVVEWKNDFL